MLGFMEFIFDLKRKKREAEIFHREGLFPKVNWTLEGNQTKPKQTKPKHRNWMAQLFILVAVSCFASLLLAVDIVL